MLLNHFYSHRKSRSFGPEVGILLQTADIVDFLKVSVAGCRQLDVSLKIVDGQESDPEYSEKYVALVK